MPTSWRADSRVHLFCAGVCSATPSSVAAAAASCSASLADVLYHVIRITCYSVPLLLLSLLVAVLYVWRQKLDSDFRAFREPLKHSARLLCAQWTGAVEIDWDSATLTRSPCTLTIHGLLVPNPEPPPGVEAWSAPHLLRIGELHLDFGSVRHLLQSCFGVLQSGDLILGYLVSHLFALRIKEVNLHIESVTEPKGAHKAKGTSNLKLLTGFDTLEAAEANLEAAEARADAADQAEEKRAQEEEARREELSAHADVGGIGDTSVGTPCALLDSPTLAAVESQLKDMERAATIVQTRVRGVQTRVRQSISSQLPKLPRQVEQAASLVGSASRAGAAANAVASQAVSQALSHAAAKTVVGTGAGISLAKDVANRLHADQQAAIANVRRSLGRGADQVSQATWRRKALRPLLWVERIEVHDVRVTLSETKLEAEEEAAPAPSPASAPAPASDADTSQWLLPSGLRQAVKNTYRDAKHQVAHLKFAEPVRELGRARVNRAIARAVNSKALINRFELLDLFGPANVVVRTVLLSLLKVVMIRMSTRVVSSLLEAPKVGLGRLGWNSKERLQEQGTQALVMLSSETAAVRLQAATRRKQAPSLVQRLTNGDAMRSAKGANSPLRPQRSKSLRQSLFSWPRRESRLSK